MKIEPKNMADEILQMEKGFVEVYHDEGCKCMLKEKKKFLEHILWQEQEIASLKKSLRAWIHKFTNLVIENEELKRKPVRYRNE